MDDDNSGLWLAAIVLGSTGHARAAASSTPTPRWTRTPRWPPTATDDFIWGTGWTGHRLDLGVRMSDRASSHVVGQLQKFKDSPIQAERDDVPQPATGSRSGSATERAASGAARRRGAVAARFGCSDSITS